MRELPTITIDTTKGLFVPKDKSFAPVDVLTVVVLTVRKGREFYGQKHSAGSKASAVCYSSDGTVPSLPFDLKSKGRTALSGLCQLCPQYANRSCKPLWSAVIVLPDLNAYHLLGSRPSHNSLEQWSAHLNRVCLESGKQWSDFRLDLKLEKRNTMKNFGLAYPSVNALTPIPFNQTISDLHAEFNSQNMCEPLTTVLKEQTDYKEQELEHQLVPVGGINDI